MALPIIIFYAFGIILFVLALESESKKDETFHNDEKKSPNDLIYAGLSFFVNLVAYYISYSNADYVDLAYLPLALIVMSIILLLYRVYGYLPKGDDPWGDDIEENEFRKSVM